jgi:hypothetical protein
MCGLRLIRRLRWYEAQVPVGEGEGYLLMLK